MSIYWCESLWEWTHIGNSVTTGGSRGAEYHPWQLKICQKSGKRGKNYEKSGKKEDKLGRKDKNREGSFTLPLLTDRAGYATAYWKLESPAGNFYLPFWICATFLDTSEIICLLHFSALCKLSHSVARYGLLSFTLPSSIWLLRHLARVVLRELNNQANVIQVY